MERKEAPLFAAGFLLILLFLSVWPASRWWHGFNNKRQAKPVMDSLEGYRAKHGEYPESLEGIGSVRDESGPLSYDRKSTTAYILWFGTTLGESVTLDSTWGS